MCRGVSPGWAGMVGGGLARKLGVLESLNAAIQDRRVWGVKTCRIWKKHFYSPGILEFQHAWDLSLVATWESRPSVSQEAEGSYNVTSWFPSAPEARSCRVLACPIRQFGTAGSRHLRGWEARGLELQAGSRAGLIRQASVCGSRPRPGGARPGRAVSSAPYKARGSGNLPAAKQAASARKPPRVSACARPPSAAASPPKHLPSRLPPPPTSLSTPRRTLRTLLSSSFYRPALSFHSPI